jgi:acyl-CoA synthetase (AMP-forming)/AMP-acid ligase II
MMGKMQDWPLLVSRLIDHAGCAHGTREIVTNLVEGGLHRYTWADALRRSKQLASALEKLGLQRGERVATMAWNTHRHLECWYGIAGAGMVYHTLNPRLFADQLDYIVNHAEDAAVLFDISFVPIIAKLAARASSVRHWIALTDAAHKPEIPGLTVLTYEELIAAESGTYAWPDLDENAPCGLCYTSGTTGNPKGVLYSHRSNVLHTYCATMSDTLGISSSSVILPVVPMFHANSWGIPFAAAATGAKLVLGGPAFDAPTLFKMIEDEKVNFTAAVPTVWLGMLSYLEETGKKFSTLKFVTIGGSAAPRVMIEKFQKNYGVQVNHAWGMTETSPLGTVGTLNAEALTLSDDEKLDVQSKQGRALFGVEIKITDDSGKELPHDGKAFGHLLVRGPWVVAAYFKGEGGDILDSKGYFDTGDVATIDPMGYMQITDRAKDVIKSGGEWISSIEIENIAVGHPAVAEAAVIGVVHPKWDERPLLIIVKKPGSDIDKKSVLDFIAPKIAKWWMPDDVQFVDDLPHTATGKISKLELRLRFADYRLPTAPVS